MARKPQQRDIEARKLTLELIKLCHIRPSEKVAGELLMKACIRAEERTRKTEKQKFAYKGIEFCFQSVLEMAIYIITELQEDWKHCKELKVEWQLAKGKKAKNYLVPSIDRIAEDKNYERGNIQILSNEANRAKSAQKKMKPTAIVDLSNSKIYTFECKRQIAPTCFPGGAIVMLSM